MREPDAWLYEEYDSNGNLRVHHIWTFLPSDLKQTIKLKDIHHIELTPLYKDLSKKQIYNKENKYDSKKLTDAFCGH
jgi:hypothetical protein